MYKMQLLILTSHATYAMRGGSFLRFAASATWLWSSNWQLRYRFTTQKRKCNKKGEKLNQIQLYSPTIQWLQTTFIYMDFYFLLSTY